MIWYNPYNKTPTDEIWDREVEAGDSQTRTLVLRYDPYEVDRRLIEADSGIVIEDNPELSWAGIMRYLQGGAINQENARLLEIRLKGDVGIVHFDFGKISEDMNGDGIQNSESADNVYDTGEDIGIDGLDDAQELVQWGLSVPDTADPAGDNFIGYGEAGFSNYRYVNGTDSNAYDASRREPDDEDIDRSGVLDVANSYFSFAIDLGDEESDTTFYVDQSKMDSTGWKTYRVPILDSSAFTIVGSPFWTEIPYVRIWLESIDGDSVTVEIATMDLVSSNWEDTLMVANQELAYQAVSPDDVPKFSVAVINNQENNDYVLPPGVEGYYNDVTNVREPEQSLLMHYENFTCDTTGDTLVCDTGIVEKKLLETINMLGYNNLKMLVHGPTEAGSDDNDSILFFFRVGIDEENYYEYREILRSNWNDININFTDITGFKEYVLRDADVVNNPVIDSTDGNYRVFGNPNIRKVRYIASGVANLDPADTVSGDVWINELQVNEVRDDPGMAARLSVSGNVADLFNFVKFHRLPKQVVQII